MKIPLAQPNTSLHAFICPFCNAFSQQNWLTPGTNGSGLPPLGQTHGFQIYSIPGLKAAQCILCRKWSLWIEDEMVYPNICNAPLACADMPEDVKYDFLEARRQVVDKSPRAAAALLRLALQKLMPQLGQKGKNINDDIAALVKKGLSSQVQQSLDSLRVIGNHAVHPGKMDITDDKKIALLLFSTLNLIVEQMITQPRQVEELYGKLPESAVKEIEKRDGK